MAKLFTRTFENSTERGAWLTRHGLSRAQHLWQAIQVAPGWENALEAVLRERLNAVAVGSLEVTAGFDDTPKPLAVYESAAEPAGATQSAHPTTNAA